MGTRIAVISGGVLQQFGTPQEIYRNPANLFVAGFIGSPNTNVWDTELISNNGQHYLTLGIARIPMDKSGLAARGLQGPLSRYPSGTHCAGCTRRASCSTDENQHFRKYPGVKWQFSSPGLTYQILRW